MTNQEMDLRWILNVIRRWWWLVVLMTALATVTAYIVTSILPATYKATVTLLISPAKNSNASQLNDLMASERLALTYSQMLKDQQTLTTVVEKLGLEQSAVSLADRIEATPIRDTQLIQVTVSSSNPIEAALIANSVAEAFKTRVELLSTERYATTIKNGQDRVINLQSQLNELDLQVGKLRSKKVEKDILLESKRQNLERLWNDYKILQSNQQGIEVAIAEATGKVYIFEPVQVVMSQQRGMASASSVVSVGQLQTTGNTGSNASNLAYTYGQLIIKTPMLEKIISDLALTLTPDQLAKKVIVEPIKETQLIRITVEDADASKAELIEKSLVDAFVSQVKDLLAEPYVDRRTSIQNQLSDTSNQINVLQGEIGTFTADIAQLEAEINALENRITEYRSDFRDAEKNLENVRITAAESSDTVTISEPAYPPVSPSQSRIIYIVLSGLVGLTIGVGIPFVITIIDDRIRTEEDIRKGFGIPVLGTIHRFSREVGELVVNSEYGSVPSDDIRILGAQIRNIHQNQGIRTILVTSPTPNVGKTVVVSNLAMALAKTGLRVVAVDADLRLPRLHSVFGLQHEDGLSDSLISGAVDGCLKNTALTGLKVMTSGSIPPNPAELLSSPALENLVQKLAGKANIILVDCPPVLTTADASILAPVMDAVLLVIRAGETNNRLAERSVEALQQVKGNLVGLVLNAVEDHKVTYYKYHMPENGKKQS